MRILGVDQSLTSTGLAWLDTSTPEWWTSRVTTAAEGQSTRDRWRRMRTIGEHVRQLVWTDPSVDVVVIEGLATYGHNAGLLAGLWWQIAGPLAADGVELLTVAPSTRAKYATGSGRASKSDVLAAVRDVFPLVNVPQHDVADAVALAALGARVKGFPVEATPRPWMAEIAEQVARRELEREQ